MNEPGRHYKTNLSKITFPFMNCQSNPIVAYMRLGVAAKTLKLKKLTKWGCFINTVLRKH